MRIDSFSIVDDATDHYARTHDGRAWCVSWLPGRELDRNSAITAMQLAVYMARWADTDALRPTLESWSAELGLEFSDARQMIYASLQ